MIDWGINVIYSNWGINVIYSITPDFKELFRIECKSIFDIGVRLDHFLKNLPQNKQPLILLFPIPPTLEPIALKPPINPPIKIDNQDPVQIPTKPTQILNKNIILHPTMMPIKTTSNIRR
jgi:hypothetical protein